MWVGNVVDVREEGDTDDDEPNETPTSKDTKKNKSEWWKTKEKKMKQEEHMWFRITWSLRLADFIIDMISTCNAMNLCTLNGERSFSLDLRWLQYLLFFSKWLFDVLKRCFFFLKWVVWLWVVGVVSKQNVFWSTFFFLTFCEGECGKANRWGLSNTVESFF